MATQNTKSTTTRKRTPRTNTPKVEKPVETVTEEVSEVVEEPVKEVKQVRRAKDIDLKQMVPLRCVEDSKVIFVSRKTGAKTIWAGYDSVEWLEVSEVMTMRNQNPAILNDPRVVVDDEDIAEFLGLNKLYDQFADVEDLDSFFDKSIDEMDEILNKAPKGIKSAIATRSRKKFEDETLHDRRKIKLLEDKLKIDLNILS